MIICEILLLILICFNFRILGILKSTKAGIGALKKWMQTINIQFNSWVKIHF